VYLTDSFSTIISKNCENQTGCLSQKYLELCSEP
jgi:hypothetical protein